MRAQTPLGSYESSVRWAQLVSEINAFYGKDELDFRPFYNGLSCDWTEQLIEFIIL